MDIHTATEEAYKRGFEDGRKAKDIYRWHDLRKNPEDLPNGNWDKKLLCVVIKNVKRYYSVMSYRRAEFLHDKSKSHDKTERLGFLEQVIAWRYIEPFEEVEE